MKLNQVRQILEKLEHLAFQLPNGTFVPKHFHVTEIGKVDKQFIDCGGTKRNESAINFQLWSADDYDHQLHPEKLLKIINLAEKELGLENEPIEVEYQGNTIEKYTLDFDGEHFQLVAKQTDCLAKDACGIPEQKPRVKLADRNHQSTCNPNSGCC